MTALVSLSVFWLVVHILSPVSAADRYCYPTVDVLPWKAEVKAGAPCASPTAVSIALVLKNQREHHKCTISKGDYCWKRSLNAMKLAEGKYEGSVAIVPQHPSRYFCVAEGDGDLRIRMNTLETLQHSVSLDARDIGSRSVAVLQMIHMNPAPQCLDNLLQLPPRVLLKLIVYSFSLLDVPASTRAIVLFPLLRILNPEQVSALDDVSLISKQFLGAYVRAAIREDVKPRYVKSQIDEIILTYELMSASASFKAVLAQKIEDLTTAVKSNIISMGDGFALAIADSALDALLTHTSKSPQFNFISVMSTMIAGIFSYVKAQPTLNDALEAIVIMFSHLRVQVKGHDGKVATILLFDSELDDLFGSCTVQLSPLGQLKQALFGLKSDQMAYTLRVMKSIMLLNQPESVKQIFS